jgi:hypothetical protein
MWEDKMMSLRFRLWRLSLGLLYLVKNSKIFTFSCGNNSGFSKSNDMAPAPQHWLKSVAKPLSFDKASVSSSAPVYK